MKAFTFLTIFFYWVGTPCFADRLSDATQAANQSNLAAIQTAKQMETELRELEKEKNPEKQNEIKDRLEKLGSQLQGNLNSAQQNTNAARAVRSSLPLEQSPSFRQTASPPAQINRAMQPARTPSNVNSLYDSWAWE